MSEFLNIILELTVDIAIKLKLSWAQMEHKVVRLLNERSFLVVGQVTCSNNGQKTFLVLLLTWSSSVGRELRVLSCGYIYIEN